MLGWFERAFVDEGYVSHGLNGLELGKGLASAELGQVLSAGVGGVAEVVIVQRGSIAPLGAGRYPNGPFGYDGVAFVVVKVIAPVGGVVPGMHGWW